MDSCWTMNNPCDVLLLQFIDDTLPAESPYLYRLHPNAEIGFLTQTSEKLFRTVLEMQPRDGGVGDGGGVTREEKVKRMNVLLLQQTHLLKLSRQRFSFMIHNKA